MTEANEPAAAQRFVPGPDTIRDFRNALGHFATGVTIVTANSNNGPVGITANSFASVSLDPPLVLWSPARASSRYPVFAHAKRFSIHVLDEGQQHICHHFTRNWHGAPDLEWKKAPNGAPVLPDCLARFDCELHATHEGGDHLIVVGRVVHAELGIGEPLLFLGGQYGGFVPGR